MSWQRIDENTYIDDTLVTCAEYQLFIDEMRDNGNLFQPDHWTSHQFTQGQAREPILGVRYSDAGAFCEWLCHRQADEWQYRLPSQKEAVSFPIRLHTEMPYGYWITNATDQTYFVWIGSIPSSDPRQVLNELGNNPSLNLSGALVRARSRPLNLDRINHNLNSNPNSNRLRGIDRPFARDLSLLLKLAHRRMNALGRDLKLARAQDYARDRNLIRDFARDPSLVQTLFRDPALTSDSKLDPVVARARVIVIVLDYFQDLYIDLLTLQERTVGRSPAFEGIRIVKERKQPEDKEEYREVLQILSKIKKTSFGELKQPEDEEEYHELLQMLSNFSELKQLEDKEEYRELLQMLSNFGELKHAKDKREHLLRELLQILSKIIKSISRKWRK